jgi:RNA-splicing ligase RtcB
MDRQAIAVRPGGSATLVEEIREAYKDFAQVVDVVEGISRRSRSSGRLASLKGKGRAR